MKKVIKEEISTRRYELDWLRVFATLLLIPFHAALIFAPQMEGYYIKDAIQNDWMGYFTLYIDIWHMPFFFFIAGASAFYALDHYTKEEYQKNRTKRLAVPLIIGILLIVPIQQYFAIVHHRGYSGNFFESYPLFFQVTDYTLQGWTGNFTVSIYWFILILLLVSSITLPVMINYKKENTIDNQDKMVKPPVKIYWFLLLTIPIVLFNRLSPFYVMLLELFKFIGIFLIGFILIDEYYREFIEKNKKKMLFIALLTSIVPFIFMMILVPYGGAGNILLDFLLYIPVGLSPIFISIALLGYARKYLNTGGKRLKYASEASLPFFMLHMTVIIALGFFIVQWNIDIYLKFIIICVLSTLIVLGIYDLLVRRTNPTRILFGLKPLKKKKEN